MRDRSVAKLFKVFCDRFKQRGAKFVARALPSAADFGLALVLNNAISVVVQILSGKTQCAGLSIR